MKEKQGSPNWRKEWLAVGELPDQDVLRTIRTFADTLGQETEDVTGTREEDEWSTWLETSPLPRNVGDKLEERDVEEALKEWLPHLQEVCREPTFRLESTVERQPVHRARQISPKAIAHLAAHPEDWEQRKLRTVRPSHVLARRNTVNLNTYENRVVARLIDEFSAYLSRRVSALARLRRFFKDAWELSDQLRGTYWLQSRVTQLWGDAVEADEMAVRIEERYEELRAKLTRIVRLRESELYRAVPRGANVSASLESTNVLANDANYRFVAKLWRTWVESGHRNRDDESREKKRRQLLDAYMDFVWLVVLRALDELGWRSESGEVPEFGESVILTGAGPEKLTLIRRKNGAIALEAKGNRAEHDRLVVRPVPTVSEDREWGHSEEASVVRATLDNEESTEARGWPGRGASRCVVDPFDLLSQERMAATIRRWLLRRRWLSYPLQIDLPSLFRERLAGLDWLEMDDSCVKVVRQPPQDAIRRIREDMEDLVKKQGQGGKRRGNLEERVGEFTGELKKAAVYLRAFRGCLVCPDSPEAPQHQTEWRLDSRTFRCRCESCRAQWGLRRCGNCESRYPFIHVAGRPDVDEDESDIDWFRHLGRDMLAEPVDDPDEWGRFVCPACGEP